MTNLASINTPCIFHHCYEFGTTSVFVCMGRPVPDPLAPEGVRKKIMPMSVVMDERIATGIEYSRFFAELFRNLKHPESLEEPFSSVLAEKATEKGGSAYSEQKNENRPAAVVPLRVDVCKMDRGGVRHRRGLRIDRDHVPLRRP